MLFDIADHLAVKGVGHIRDNDENTGANTDLGGFLFQVGDECPAAMPALHHAIRFKLREGTNRCDLADIEAFHQLGNRRDLLAGY
ncbi:hypothetical protein HS121_17775 [bacterium]|nr:hypothetical protein [bacterium]